MPEDNILHFYSRANLFDRNNVQYGRGRASYQAWHETDEGEAEVANWDAARDDTALILMLTS